jgi:hypothetical protein
MKVGYKTNTDNEFKSITVPNESASPVVVSVAQTTESNSGDKFLVWHIEGGLGKNIAATGLIADIAKKYKSRKIIIVASYPEVFLNHPNVYRVYRVGMTSYFYHDYILGKDTVVFRQEPYFQSGHIMKKKHLIENWCNILNIDYKKQKPSIFMNMIQNQLPGIWNREKPILLIQTNGGSFQGQNLNYTWTRDMPIDLSLYITEKYQNDYHIIQLTREGSIKIPNVEVVDYPMTNMELIGLLLASDKRFLIDSSLQHAASAFNLKSVVFWIGTTPENFGYDLHINVNAQPPKGNVKLIDSYLFDYSFDGAVHECPYNNVGEMFSVPELDKIIEEYSNNSK